MSGRVQVVSTDLGWVAESARSESDVELFVFIIPANVTANGNVSPTAKKPTRPRSPSHSREEPGPADVACEGGRKGAWRSVLLLHPVGPDTAEDRLFQCRLRADSERPPWLGAHRLDEPSSTEIWNQRCWGTNRSELGISQSDTVCVCTRVCVCVRVLTEGEGGPVWVQAFPS